MKRVFFIKVGFALALLFSTGALQSAGAANGSTSPANPSAYSALRTMQKVLGNKTLEQIAEVSGREGVPQPYLWRVILREPNGTREVDIAAGKVTGQHIMNSKFAAGTGTLHLQELNLDSSGAFDAANAQALKARLRFDSLSYRLQIGDNGKPVWTLELFNQDGNSIGRMRLAAYNGTIASIDGRLASAPAATTQVSPAPNRPPVVKRRNALPSTELSTAPRRRATTTTTVVTERRSATNPAAGDGEESGFFTRAGRTIDHTNRQVAEGVVQTNENVQRGLRQTGAKIQRFFVGHSDLDREDNRN